jgi:hypothetical protein
MAVATLWGHGYPPDMEAEAIKTVVMQAEALSAELAASAA